MRDVTGAGQPRDWQKVVAYDWKAIDVPAIAALEPTQTVSIVIPAYNCQAKLDLTLAALAHQRYPQDLFEVVVADDGSHDPITIPEIAPANTRVIRLDRESEWGRARACHEGALAADGEILLFLDADMIAYPDHVRAHARWHHVVAEAVTLGHKLFVDLDHVTAADVADAAARDALFELAADLPHATHDWVEEWIERSADLTKYRPGLFMAAVGATVAMRADLYAEAGGFRPHLRAGEDMEFGYRLMTAGGVFIPEHEARSWHQGQATFMSYAAAVRRRNNPNFTNYIPISGTWRPWTPGRQYAVAMTDVVVTTSGTQFEGTKACVDSFLGSEEPDLHVEVCGSLPADEMDLLHAEYRGDSRVSFSEKVPLSGFPSRFTLYAPDWVGVRVETISRLIERMEQEQLGVVHVVVRGVAPDDGMLVMWRTAALHRARRASDGSEPLDSIAGRLFGERWMDGGELGVFDLRQESATPRQLKRPSVPLLVERLERAKAQSKQRQARIRTLQRRLDVVQRQQATLRQKYDALRRRRVVRAVLKLDRVKRRLRRGSSSSEHQPRM